MVGIAGEAMRIPKAVTAAASFGGLLGAHFPTAVAGANERPAVRGGHSAPPAEGESIAARGTTSGPA
jgi:hypothetical protein